MAEPIAEKADSLFSLSREDRDAIVEILERRSTEIETFRTDLENRVSKLTGQPIRFYDLPGSVEVALRREVSRLRSLAGKVRWCAGSDQVSPQARTGL